MSAPSGSLMVSTLASTILSPSMADASMEAKGVQENWVESHAPDVLEEVHAADTSMINMPDMANSAANSHLVPPVFIIGTPPQHRSQHSLKPLR